MKSKNYFCLIISVTLFHLAGLSQNINWTKLSNTLDSGAFEKLLNPSNYGVSANNLTQIEKWKNNEKIKGDSLFNLLSNWNKFPKPKQNGIICEYSLKLDTNYTVKYFVYVPKNYDPKEKTSLLLYFKGGWFSRKKLPKDYAKEIVNDNPTFAYLDKSNVIEIFPALESDLMINWKYGYKHLERMIAETKKVFNIDDNKVFLSGFSDGGRTVYMASFLTQTPFACFYPINSSFMSSPDFPNFTNRSIYSFVAKNDEINDYRSILTKAKYAISIGADWTYREIPNEKHFYYPYQHKILPILFSHLNTISRNPLKSRLEYNRGYDYEDFKGVDWLQIKVNTDKAASQFHRTDTIQTFWGGGEEHNYRYGEKTGQIRAYCFDNTYNVETSMINEVTIYISPLMINTDLPVKVIINGKELFNQKISFDKIFMTQRFMENFDRKQIFINEIVLKVD